MKNILLIVAALLSTIFFIYSLFNLISVIDTKRSKAMIECFKVVDPVWCYKNL